MHPVLGKIKLKSFEGTFDVHGTDREVTYVEPEGDGGLPAALVIKGLSVEDAFHVLSRLHGGLLKGEDAQPAPTSEPAKQPKAAKAEKKVEAKAEPKPEPTPPPKIEVVDASADDVDVLEDDAEAPPQGDLVEELAKCDKLRSVVEVMISKGYKTPERIVAISRELKAKVPALVEVEAKGNFDKRMERAALVVLGGD